MISLALAIRDDIFGAVQPGYLQPWRKHQNRKLRSGSRKCARQDVSSCRLLRSAKAICLAAILHFHGLNMVEDGFRAGFKMCY